MIYLAEIEAYAFTELINLKTVIIRYLPKIQYVDAKAFTGTVNEKEFKSPVQDFTFSYSIIKSLPEELFDWDNMKYLDLHNNRWHCDCEYAWIKGSAVEKMVGESM